eukprot:scaffold660_cov365-Pavlova_lutheri.AAC.1
MDHDNVSKAPVSEKRKRPYSIRKIEDRKTTQVTVVKCALGGAVYGRSIQRKRQAGRLSPGHRVAQTHAFGL